CPASSRSAKARAPARIRGTACPVGAAAGCTFGNASRVSPTRRLLAAARRPCNSFHWQINGFHSLALSAVASRGPATVSCAGRLSAVARALLFPQPRRSGPRVAARAALLMTPPLTTQHSGRLRLIRLIWPFVAIVLLLLAIGSTSLEV